MSLFTSSISCLPLISGRNLSALLALLLIGYRPDQTPNQTAALPGKEQILDAIGSKALAHDPHLQFQVKPWKHRPGSFLTLVYITAPVKDDLDTGDGTEIVRATRLQPTLAFWSPSTAGS